MSKAPISVSMSTFAEFATRSGPTKLSLVKSWKNKPSYTPSLDFYKAVREAIPEYCQKRINKSGLEKVIDEAGAKRIPHYKSVVSGFLKWKATKSGVWRDPVEGTWLNSGISVHVVPELGYEHNDITTYVKLYFKSTKLTRYHADVYLELMASSLPVKMKKNIKFAVLDVKNAKEFDARGSKPTIHALIQAEAMYWSSLWNVV